MVSTCLLLGTSARTGRSSSSTASRSAGDRGRKQVSPLLRAGFRVITYDRRGFGSSSQPSVGYDYDTFAQHLHLLLTQLDLREVVLDGFSMGGGEVARYLGRYGSARVRAAAFLSSIPPFLLKTAETPNGLDQSVFDDIQAAIAEDRFAYLTRFFHDFYNLDVLLGSRISQEAARDSRNVAVGVSPIGTWACPKTWHTDFRDDLRRIRAGRARAARPSQAARRARSER
jgi:non-heme chloroperoxidase